MAYEFFNKWAPIFMVNLQKDFNIDVEDSAAIIGNGGHESNGFKSLQEVKPLIPGSKGGYGIMQWTGPRRREYEAYCKRNNLDPAAMETNYKFLFVELKGPEGRVLQKMKAVKGLKAKTKVFSETFLRPGIPHMDSRYIWAERALKAYDVAPTEPVQSVPEPKPTEPTSSSPKTFLELIIAILKIIFGKK